jgi:hypothetical protein
VQKYSQRKWQDESDLSTTRFVTSDDASARPIFKTLEIEPTVIFEYLDLLLRTADHLC